MKTAYIVLGAQRSGTSAASHMLSQFGVDFGQYDHFLQDDHNPIFFELKWVNDCNNKIIDALNYQYTDFFLPIESDFESADTTDIESEITTLMAQEWNNQETIGIKDPRISLTFPIWEKLLTQQNYTIKVILVFRRPTNFLKSNQRLFHNWIGWTKERHLNFWLQLNLAAVYLCRSHPIYFLNYEQLIANPIQEATDLANCLEFDSSKIAEAASVIQPAQTHHQSVDETGMEFVDRAYELLCNYALSPAEYLQLRSASYAGAI